jgi:hypothetical protein
MGRKPQYTCGLCNAKQNFDGLETSMIKSIRNSSVVICEPCELGEKFVRRNYANRDTPLVLAVSAEEWQDKVFETRTKTTDDLIAKSRKTFKRVKPSPQ